MDYQKIILVGNACQDAQKKQSKNGSVSFTTFNLGVSDSKDHTTFFPVTVFGKLGESLVSHIQKGRQLLVEGRLEVNEKGYFNVIAAKIRLGAKPGEKKTE